MIMGPQDLGLVVNTQLSVVSRFLERWFSQRRTEDGSVPGSQGFLEYLYELLTHSYTVGLRLTSLLDMEWCWSRRRMTKPLWII